MELLLVAVMSFMLGALVWSYRHERQKWEGGRVSRARGGQFGCSKQILHLCGCIKDHGHPDRVHECSHGAIMVPDDAVPDFRSDD